MSRRALAALAGLAGLGLATPAHALLCGTFLSPLTVSASGVAFGDYLATDLAPSETTGTITLTCTIPLDVLPDFTVALSTGSSGTYANRRMASGGSQLLYNLYTTADYATVWGNGTAGTATQIFTGALLTASINFTIYGLAPAEQWSQAGSYQDTIVVTVTY